MTTLIASCTCGRVAYEAVGMPIVTVSCHCDDCQAAGRELEALPGAPPLLDAAGGTPSLLYRRDRVTCVAGEELVSRRKRRPDSPTHRIVADCCNSAMMIAFDSAGPFWLSLYRARIASGAPPVEMRVQTKFAPAPEALGQDVPVYKRFPPGVVVRLLRAWIGVLLRR